MYEVMHSGAWVPVWAFGEDYAWGNLLGWLNDNCDNRSRLVVTPKLASNLNNHAGLQAIANGAARQDAQGRGPGKNWVVGSGPIFIVWPDEATVQHWVGMTAGLPNQSIILIEQAITDDAVSFEGWATAVGAFDTAEGEYMAPNTHLLAEVSAILTDYENELTAVPKPGPLRDRMLELGNDRHDTDFIVTSAIALGYQGNLKLLRRHYEEILV
jgi:hypothetical protein